MTVSVIAAALLRTDLPYAGQLKIIHDHIEYLFVLLPLAWDGFKKN